MRREGAEPLSSRSMTEGLPADCPESYHSGRCESARRAATLVADPKRSTMADQTASLALRAGRPGTAADRCTSSLSRVGVTGVEKVIRIRSQRRGAALPRAPRVRRRPRPAPEGRAHVALRGGRQRRDRRGRARRVGLPRRDARPARRRARARPPGGAPRRGAHRRALPRAQAGARVGDPHPGDLQAVRRRGRERARHAPHHRRRRAGHDGLPVRAGARGRGGPRAARRRTASPTTRSSRSSRTSPSRPTTSAGSARSTSAAPRPATTRSTRADLLRIVEELDVLGDLRADEALRRGAPWSRRPTAARASSRTACAR